MAIGNAKFNLKIRGAKAPKRGWIWSLTLANLNGTKELKISISKGLRIRSNVYCNPWGAFAKGRNRNRHLSQILITDHKFSLLISAFTAICSKSARISICNWFQRFAQWISLSSRNLSKITTARNEELLRRIRNKSLSGLNWFCASKYSLTIAIGFYFFPKLFLFQVVLISSYFYSYFNYADVQGSCLCLQGVKLAFVLTDSVR